MGNYHVVVKLKRFGIGVRECGLIPTFACALRNVAGLLAAIWCIKFYGVLLILLRI